jgi:hypothetical protein
MFHIGMTMNWKFVRLNKIREFCVVGRESPTRCNKPEYCNTKFHFHENWYTRWFKYDRDKLWLVYTQIVPVIFEPPCIFSFLCVCVRVCVRATNHVGLRQPCCWDFYITQSDIHAVGTSSERVITLSHNLRNKHETHIRAVSDHRNLAASDLRPRWHGHRDRPQFDFITLSTQNRLGLWQICRTKIASACDKYVVPKSPRTVTKKY